MYFSFSSSKEELLLPQALRRTERAAINQRPGANCRGCWISMSSCPALWLKPTSLQDAILCLDPLPQLPPQDLLHSCFLWLKTKMQGLSSHTEPCITAATSVLAVRRSSSSHQAIDLSVRARLSPKAQNSVDISLSLPSGSQWSSHNFEGLLCRLLCESVSHPA